MQMHKLHIKVDVIIFFTLETQMHTAGPIDRAQCDTYCERQSCNGDARVQPCILHFFLSKRNYEKYFTCTLHSVKIHTKYDEMHIDRHYQHNPVNLCHRNISFLPLTITTSFLNGISE